MIEFIEKYPKLSLVLATGLLTLIGILVRIISDVILTKIKKSNDISIEQEKLNSNLIMKAIETDNYRKSINNLHFLLEIGAIHDKNDKLKNIIDGKTDINIPALKTGKIELKVDNRDSIFAVQSDFEGHCIVNINNVKVNLNRASIKLTDKYSHKSVYIDKVSAGLGTKSQNGNWNIIKNSEPKKVGQQIESNESVEIGQHEFKINRDEIDELNNYWVIFTIWQKDKESGKDIGTTYVHFRDLDKI